MREYQKRTILTSQFVPVYFHVITSEPESKFRFMRLGQTSRTRKWVQEEALDTLLLILSMR